MHRLQGWDLHDPWQSSALSTKQFSSEGERNFMTQLRNIHINARILNISTVMGQLFYLFCVEYRSSPSVLSEVSTDTALRSVIFILGTISELEPNVGEVEMAVVMSTYAQLYSDFSSINRSENLIDRLINNPVYAMHVEFRQTMLLNELLEMIGRVEESQVIFYNPPLPPHTVVPMLEVGPENPSSTWWKKLLDSEAQSAPMEENEVDQCSVCLNDNVTQRNYAILNNCVHRFCVECITQWFIER